MAGGPVGLGPSMREGRALRGVAAWVLLAIVLWSVIGAYAEFRKGSTAPPAAPAVGGEREATESAPATEAPEGSSATPEEERRVEVLTEGLNLREQPSTSSRVIKRLSKGTRLTVIEEAFSWYRVRDPDGDEGWVAKGGQYTRLVQ